MSNTTNIGMDLLIHARIPFLDEYLSGPSQSVLFEVLFWTTLYLIWATVASRIIRSTLSKMPFWNGDVKLRSGVFCANGQDDVVLLYVIGIHHACAGYMCYLGARNNDGNMWRHGYLLETGFELADILAMALSMYPYRLDNVKPEMYGALIFHHLPGLLFSGIILNSGLNENPHIQEIAFQFLAGACFSTLGGAVGYGLSLETQMLQSTALFLSVVVHFAYCRFYVFPRESFLLLTDMANDPVLTGSLVQKCLQVAGGFFFLFNFAILVDTIPKTYRYIKRCFDGVTPIDTAEIPLSREDRLKQRRRSTIMKAVDMIRETTKRRRSSLETIMGLNIIENLHQAEKELKIRKSMGEKDFAAMRETMNRLDGSSGHLSSGHNKID